MSSPVRSSSRSRSPESEPEPELDGRAGGPSREPDAEPDSPAAGPPPAQNLVLEPPARGGFFSRLKRAMGGARAPERPTAVADVAGARFEEPLVEPDGSRAGAGRAGRAEPTAGRARGASRTGPRPDPRAARAAGQRRRRRCADCGTRQPRSGAPPPVLPRLIGAPARTLAIHRQGVPVNWHSSTSSPARRSSTSSGGAPPTATRSQLQPSRRKTSFAGKLR